MSLPCWTRFLGHHPRCVPDETPSWPSNSLHSLSLAPISQLLALFSTLPSPFSISRPDKVTGGQHECQHFPLSHSDKAEEAEADLARRSWNGPLASASRPQSVCARTSAFLTRPYESWINSASNSKSKRRHSSPRFVRARKRVKWAHARFKQKTWSVLGGMCILTGGCRAASDHRRLDMLKSSMG